MVSVSVVPDLDEVRDLISKSPIAVIISSTESSFADVDEPFASPPPTLVRFTLILPPALKKNLISLAFENVTVCSTVCEPTYLVADLELRSSEPAEIAVAFGDPVTVNSASSPEQIEEGPLKEAVGVGSTLIVMDASSEHPLASVPVTVYIVVDVGETEIVEPV